MSWKIEIPRKHLSLLPAKAGRAQVAMYFDVEFTDLEAGFIEHEGTKTPKNSWKATGFRLVKGVGGLFLGFPYAAGKNSDRYPQFQPSKPLADAILARAEQVYQQEIMAP